MAIPFAVGTVLSLVLIATSAAKSFQQAGTYFLPFLAFAILLGVAFDSSPLIAATIPGFGPLMTALNIAGGGAGVLAAALTIGSSAIYCGVALFFASRLFSGERIVTRI